MLVVTSITVSRENPRMLSTGLNYNNYNSQSIYTYCTVDHILHTETFRGIFIADRDVIVMICYGPKV